MKPDRVTREEIFAIVEDARSKNKNKKTHVRAELVKRYPDLEGQTIRRNGHTYNVLDYLLDDVESYGTAS